MNSRHTSTTPDDPRTAHPAPRLPTSRSLALRRFRDQDLALLVPWLEDRESAIRWAGPAAWPIDRDQLRRTLTAPDAQTYLAHLDRGPPYPCGVFRLADPAASPHHVAHLSHLMVAPHHRHAGLGRLLLNCALEIAYRRFDAHDIELHVWRDNTIAYRLYRQAGFSPVRLSPLRCGSDPAREVVTLRRRLPPAPSPERDGDH